VNDQARIELQYARKKGWEALLIGPSSRTLSEDDTLATCAPIALPLNGSKARLGLNPKLYFNIQNCLKSFRPDVIHLHEPFAPLINTVLTWKAKVPLVGTFHSYTESGQGYHPYRKALAWQWRKLSRRIAVSKLAQNLVTRSFAGPIEIIPNCIDLASVPCCKKIAQQPPSVILFIGRCDEKRKGFELLWEAMSQLERRFPREFELWVIGSGQSSWHDQNPSFSVKWWGFLEKKELYQKLSQSDLFCQSATGGESFGLVTLEALACGRPVVAFDIAAHREWLSSCTAATLVENKNVTKLAQAIEQQSRSRHDPHSALACAQLYSSERTLNQLFGQAPFH